MALQATAAARVLEEDQEHISSHKLISLLMEGGLERAAQAKSRLEAGDAEEAHILVGRLVGIIDGLRSTLNLEQGGDIALNLDALYQYMLGRVESSDVDASAVAEVGELLTEVKVGWDQIQE